MKTENDIKNQIDELTEEIHRLELSYKKEDQTRAKRLRSQLSELRQYELFIKTNPSSDFIQKEINRIENRVNEIMKHYTPLDEGRFKRSDITKHRSEFERKWDLPKIKKQLSALKYLNS